MAQGQVQGHLPRQQQHLGGDQRGCQSARSEGPTTLSSQASPLQLLQPEDKGTSQTPLGTQKLG